MPFFRKRIIKYLNIDYLQRQFHNKYYTLIISMDMFSCWSRFRSQTNNASSVQKPQKEDKQKKISSKMNLRKSYQTAPDRQQQMGSSLNQQVKSEHHCQSEYILNTLKQLMTVTKKEWEQFIGSETFKSMTPYNQSIMSEFGKHFFMPKVEQILYEKIGLKQKLLAHQHKLKAFCIQNKLHEIISQVQSMELDVQQVNENLNKIIKWAKEVVAKKEKYQNVIASCTIKLKTLKSIIISHDQFSQYKRQLSSELIVFKQSNDNLQKSTKEFLLNVLSSQQKQIQQIKEQIERLRLTVKDKKIIITGLSGQVRDSQREIQKLIQQQKNMKQNGERQLQKKEEKINELQKTIMIYKKEIKFLSSQIGLNQHQIINVTTQLMQKKTIQVDLTQIQKKLEKESKQNIIYQQFIAKKQSLQKLN